MQLFQNIYRTEIAQILSVIHSLLYYELEQCIIFVTVTCMSECVAWELQVGPEFMSLWLIGV